MTVIDLFSASVRRFPNQAAVKIGDKSLTYKQLNVVSNQLAHFLAAKGVLAGDRVPLLLPKTLDGIISILAVLKLGASFIPIDVELPSDGIISILKSLEAKYCLTFNGLSKKLRSVDIISISLDVDRARIAEQPKNAIDVSPSSDDLAYIIYTSGTTGIPKGVCISHQALLAVYNSWNEVFNLTAVRHKHLQMANMCFDVFVGDFVRALCSGGMLILCDRDTLIHPDKLFSLIQSEGVTFAEFVPIVLKRLVDHVKSNNEKLMGFSTIISGSDKWLVKDVLRLSEVCSPGTMLANTYGCTEATVDSAFYICDIDSLRQLPEAAPVPIGEAFAHAKLFVLDAEKKVCAPGDVGELYVAGEALFSGYLGQDVLTQKVLTTELVAGASVKLYRTGDFALVSKKSGALVYVGRENDQVKVHGKRVNLDALEAVLKHCDEIDDVVVLPNLAGRLCAFIKFHARPVSHSQLVDKIRDALSKEYVPSHFYMVDRLLITPNGKRNRKFESQCVSREIVPEVTKPRNSVESVIWEIWQELLAVEHIGVESDFFDFGGTSLKYHDMLMRVEKAFGVKMELACGSMKIEEIASKVSMLKKDQRSYSNLNKVIVVGGGPAAITVCAEIIKEAEGLRSTGRLDIKILDKSNVLGSGLPYSAKEDAYILNLPVQAMGMSSFKQNFSDWMAANELSGKYTDFPPRYLYGLYLQEMGESLISYAESLGHKITFHGNEEVISVNNTVNNRYSVETRKGSCIADYIVLCTGHMPSDQFVDFVGEENFYANPWELETSNVMAHDRVALIGSRLTAIDSALKLASNGYKGKIHMFSRSGLLPAVLSPTVPPYTLKHLTLENFNAITQFGLRKMKLEELLELFWREVAEAEGGSFDKSVVPFSSRDISPKDWMDWQITSAEKGPKPWQQALFALYPIVSNIWGMLSFSAKKEFFARYNSAYMTYLAAFPLDNAYKVKRLLDDEQLLVHGGVKDVSSGCNGFTISTGTNVYDFPVLIDATGPGYNPSLMVPYSSMLKKGFVAKHHFGGLDVDPVNLQIMNKAGNVQKGVYAVGELAHGACLATTDMTRVRQHAERVAYSLSRQIQRRNHAAAKVRFFNKFTSSSRTQLLAKGTTTVMRLLTKR